MPIKGQDYYQYIAQHWPVVWCRRFPIVECTVCTVCTVILPFRTFLSVFIVRFLKIYTTRYRTCHPLGRPILQHHIRWGSKILWAFCKKMDYHPLPSNLSWATNHKRPRCLSVYPWSATSQTRTPVKHVGVIYVLCTHMCCSGEEIILPASVL